MDYTLITETRNKHLKTKKLSSVLCCWTLTPSPSFTCTEHPNHSAYVLSNQHHAFPPSHPLMQPDASHHTPLPHTLPHHDGTNIPIEVSVKHVDLHIKISSTSYFPLYLPFSSLSFTPSSLYCFICQHCSVKALTNCFMSFIIKSHCQNLTAVPVISLR